MAWRTRKIKGIPVSHCEVVGQQQPHGKGRWWPKNGTRRDSSSRGTKLKMHGLCACESSSVKARYPFLVPVQPDPTDEGFHCGECSAGAWYRDPWLETGTAAKEEKELRTRQNPEASWLERKGREQKGAKGLQKPSSTHRSTVSTLPQTALHAAHLMLSWVPRAAPC